MGIDITELDEDELLPTLGTGDWLVALPDNHPDILITQQWRQELHDIVARTFVRWVINGVVVEIRHHNDPSWDQSGDAYREQVDPLILLARHATLQTWLHDEYTGNSTASYVSGLGLFWDTYHEHFRNEFEQNAYELIKTHLQAVLGYDEDDDIWMDIMDEPTWVQSSVIHAILLEIGLLSTKTVWQNLKNEIYLELEEEKRLAEERAARAKIMRQKVREFWQHHFADLEGQRIEMPQFKALMLEDRLRNVLADTDPDTIEAIVEMGLPASFSNTVTMAIQTLAREALK